jgi:hypothetical protein
MLKLRSSAAPIIPVSLPGGALWRLRAATTFEVDGAIAESTRVLAGLRAAGECAEQAAAILGEEFRGADFLEDKWLAAAAEQLAIIMLADACTESWHGMGDEAGNPIEKPAREHVVIALRDPVICRSVKAALYAGVHAEQAEKNG